MGTRNVLHHRKLRKRTDLRDCLFRCILAHAHPSPRPLDLLQTTLTTMVALGQVEPFRRHQFLLGHTKVLEHPPRYLRVRHRSLLWLRRDLATIPMV